MDKCAICGQKSRYPIAHAGIGYCPEHFMRYVEKKIKSGAREIGIFKRNKRMGFLLDGYAGSSAVFMVMEEIAKKMGSGVVGINGLGPASKEVVQAARKNSLKVIITGHTVDDYVLRILLLCSSKKSAKLLKLGPKTGIWGNVFGFSFPSPAFRLYRTELEGYAKLKGFSTERAEKKNKLEAAFSSFIEKMETEHPGTKHKMLKSLLYFSKDKAKVVN